MDRLSSVTDGSYVQKSFLFRIFFMHIGTWVGRDRGGNDDDFMLAVMGDSKSGCWWW